MANDGQSLTSAAGSPVLGAFRSSTMIVMMTAMTPSENASTRALENEPWELDIGRSFRSQSLAARPTLATRQGALAERRFLCDSSPLTPALPRPSARAV